MSRGRPEARPNVPVAIHTVLELYVDADSCPVKDEIYRVAYRYALTVHVVANQSVHVAASDSFHFVLVGDRFDEADDWIAERASEGDIVITADIMLAARCLENNARVLGPRGLLAGVFSCSPLVLPPSPLAVVRYLSVLCWCPSWRCLLALAPACPPLVA